jgi:hypothetical protein
MKMGDEADADWEVGMIEAGMMADMEAKIMEAMMGGKPQKRRQTHGPSFIDQIARSLSAKTNP